MALYYFDTSVLVKYYIFEPGSGWVRERVDARVPDGNTRANIIFVSEVCITESAAAFAIL
ncbi:MAG: type II toxin-antitoxin system VapC family toxin [Anaerolineae bacterium]